MCTGTGANAKCYQWGITVSGNTGVAGTPAYACCPEVTGYGYSIVQTKETNQTVCTGSGQLFGGLPPSGNWYKDPACMVATSMTASASRTLGSLAGALGLAMATFALAALF